MNVLNKTMDKVMQPETIVNFSESQISELVDKFYKRIHDDKRLGKIFANEITGSWEEHTDKMKSFWRSILLKTREYNGRPVPKHQKLEGIETNDFVKWLSIFRVTAQEIFTPSSAQLAIKNAENIATSLWLSMNNDPFEKPPNWSTLQAKTQPMERGN